MTKDSDLATFARQMRREPTEPEKRLWRNLSSSQLGGFKFRRQAVIDTWIVDFLCPAKALIIEVDGDTHDPDADWRRDVALDIKGYRTVRFTNAEVIQNMGGVLEAILAALRLQTDRWPSARPHPHPSPEGDGLK